MSPRARSIPDTTILDHVCEVLAGAGRDAVTFAQIAHQCGLAPATLVQRFGTREGMLAAAGQALSRQVVRAFGTPSPTPLTRLYAGSSESIPSVKAALCLAPGTGAEQFCLELRKQISYALAAAVEASELPHCNVAQLARTIQIGIMGAIATARLEGVDAGPEVSEAIEAQLAAFI